jgi:hypothetical protein
MLQVFGEPESRYAKRGDVKAIHVVRKTVNQKEDSG